MSSNCTKLLLDLVKPNTSSTDDKSNVVAASGLKRSHSVDQEYAEPSKKVLKSNDGRSTLLRGLLDDIVHGSKQVFKESTGANLSNTEHHSGPCTSAQNNKAEDVAIVSANDSGSASLVNGKSKEGLTNPSELIAPPLENGINGNDVITIDDDTPESESSTFDCGFTKCGICKKLLAGQNPVLLGCLHSFCSECLLQRKYFRLTSALKTNENGNSETLDQQKIEAIPDSAFKNVDSLKKYLHENAKEYGKLVIKCDVCECNTRAKVIIRNHFVPLSSSLPNSEGNVDKAVDVKLCTNCEEVLHAVRYCKDCNEYLCEECVNAHKRTKLTKEHTLEVLESAAKEQEKEKQESTYGRCAYHPNEELKLYCESCNVLTCRDCQLDSHRQHKYMFVKEAALFCGKSLETMRQKLSEKKFFLNQTTNTIVAHLENVLKAREKTNKDIIDMHSRLQQVLTEKCQLFLTKVGQITSYRHSKLNVQRTCTQRLAAAVQHCIDFIDFAIQEHNYLPLLGAKQMILEYVTTVIRQKFTTTPCLSGEMSFTPDDETAKRISSSLGALVWGSAPNNRNLMQGGSPRANARHAVSHAATNQRGNAPPTQRMQQPRNTVSVNHSSAATARSPNTMVTPNQRIPNVMVSQNQRSSNVLVSQNRRSPNVTVTQNHRPSNVTTMLNQRPPNVMNAHNHRVSNVMPTSNQQSPNVMTTHLQRAPNMIALTKHTHPINQAHPSQPHTIRYTQTFNPPPAGFAASVQRRGSSSMPVSPSHNASMSPHLHNQALQHRSQHSMANANKMPSTSRSMIHTVPAVSLQKPRPTFSPATRNGGLVPHIAENIAKPEISRQCSQELKPFVTKMVSREEQFASDFNPGTSQASGSSKSLEMFSGVSKASPVTKQALSFLAEIPAVTQQQVVPKLASNQILSPDVLPSAGNFPSWKSTRRDQRSSSSDSGIASSSAKPDKDGDLSSSPITSSSVLAPPKLIDLGNIIKMDEEEDSMEKETSNTEQKESAKVENNQKEELAVKSDQTTTSNSPSHDSNNPDHNIDDSNRESNKSDHENNESDHENNESNHEDNESDHEDNESDHEYNESDHEYNESDHEDNESDHEDNESDHQNNESDHEGVSQLLLSLAEKQKKNVKKEKTESFPGTGCSHVSRDENDDYSQIGTPYPDEKYLYEENGEERTFDPNEDWCAVCNNGGDLLCCDTCPKVFHLHCHVPEIITTPPGTWQCTLCRDVSKAIEAEMKTSKRKRISSFGLKELKVCEKLLLELYCHPQSVPFHHPVRASVPNYYKVIKEPIDLSKIKKRLQPSNFSHYELEKEFLRDIQLMFTNCFRFNAGKSTIHKMGKKLQKFFLERVKERMPTLSDFVEQLMEEQKKYLDENPLEEAFDASADFSLSSYVQSSSDTDESSNHDEALVVSDDDDLYLPLNKLQESDSDDETVAIGDNDDLNLLQNKPQESDSSDNRLVMFSLRLNEDVESELVKNKFVSVKNIGKVVVPPHTCKKPCYICYRAKNNLSCKNSRERKISRKKAVEMQTKHLKQENIDLREQIQQLEAQTKELYDLIKQRMKNFAFANEVHYVTNIISKMNSENSGLVLDNSRNQFPLLRQQSHDDENENLPSSKQYLEEKTVFLQTQNKKLREKIADLETETAVMRKKVEKRFKKLNKTTRKLLRCVVLKPSSNDGS